MKFCESKGAFIDNLRMPYIRIVGISVLILALAGCATTHVASPQKKTAPLEKEQGFYHQVVKGETLWRISKIYNVDIDRIAAINDLNDAKRIEAGQMIFVPSAKKPLETSVYAREDFIWPVKGKIISSFGEQTGGSPSKGIDIQAREGAVVVASRGGRVIFLDEKVKGYGKTIILDHGDGFQTIYAHNSEILVKVGEEVKQCAPIAKAGSSGRIKTPYLHFEIRSNHQPKNPFYYLP